uniref:Dynein light chain Tctex-type 1 n=1 Tax=Fibrocapsa japonica TaxID=94617 RepID=A0A7S2UUF8_9STRA|mmetsp:Transcript_14052/g.20720  ORF Transcript_14052/g.20720 Transcript_14052/m.20720 type:complete len:120 (+) Transcript_14052:166-525(+)|eukprot:CAMPEP_0113935642 /NCGR_PEP_ID=MMETSP1339-20121228/2763_1 /TAXON_ID=94617 /ORGANISM="Fibrocapsa japonica" /LENGTH=119 /DNA_ID=CAMNT_0000937869 /DNA_START=166 /DNA_END=525 /DNA_ORIENTATION=+ /assembly_acc=CAM_ASM_000762
MSKTAVTSVEHVYDFPQLQEMAAEVAQRALTSVLEGKRFQTTKLAEWTDLVTQECLAGLARLSRNFKYTVSCLLFEKEQGAQMTSAVTAYWDPRTDGSFTLRWENDSMSCVLVISGYAL